jgi:hypothetical protein
MSDSIAGVMSQSGMANSLSAALRQSQQNQGGRSFQDVLGSQNARNTTGSSLAEQPAQVSGAQLERMRVELAQRINNLTPGSSKINALLPELIDSRTRMGLLREAMKGVGPQAQGTDLRGRFAQVENEWLNIESLMRSNKDLSTGELLGLQARLYQVSQHVEVMSKVVDQVTSGIKTILNTTV